MTNSIHRAQVREWCASKSYVELICDRPIFDCDLLVMATENTTDSWPDEEHGDCWWITGWAWDWGRKSWVMFQIPSAVIKAARPLEVDLLAWIMRDEEAWDLCDEENVLWPAKHCREMFEEKPQYVLKRDCRQPRLEWWRWRMRSAPAGSLWRLIAFDETLNSFVFDRLDEPSPWSLTDLYLAPVTEITELFDLPTP